MLASRVRGALCFTDASHLLFPTLEEAFDGKLEFDIKVILYEGDTSCVEETILNAINVSNQTSSPLRNLIVIFAGIERQ